MTSMTTTTTMTGTRTGADDHSSWMVVGLGIAATMGFAAVALTLATRSPGENWAALAIATVLFLVSVPVLLLTSRRMQVRGLQWLLVGALGLRLVGAIAAHYVSFEIHNGVSDARAYHTAAETLSEQFASGDWSIPDKMEPVGGTEVIKIATGLLYLVIGPTMLGGFVVYSWLAFWGLFAFFRAFCLAVPNGNPRMYAALLFFLPSLLFWPSSIGKDAWMLFALGIAAYGIARLLVGSLWWGLAIAGIGLAMAASVRPHVAGMLAVAMAFASAFRFRRNRNGLLAPVVTLVILGTMAAGAVFFLGKAGEILDTPNVYTFQGATQAITAVGERSADGDSQFAAPSILASPAKTPLAIVTVLFRPFIYEAHNLPAAMAAAEGSLLMLFSVLGIRRLLRSVRTVRRQPYVGAALVFTAVFIVAFSSLGNFGLLARQRIQVYPFYLVPLAIPLKQQLLGGRGKVAQSAAGDADA